MVRTAALILAIALTVGCSDRVGQLQNQLDTMESAGASPNEVCGQARKITAAALERGPEAVYREKKRQSDVECLSASVEPFPELAKSITENSADALDAAANKLENLP